MSSKSPIPQQQSSDLELVTVRAVHAIKDHRVTHAPGSVFEAPRKDADRLIEIGAVVPATDAINVPIEEILPPGMDPKLWRADPRATVNGQRPSVFVLRAEFDEYLKANR